MTKSTVLLGSKSFKTRLEEVAKTANESFLVQTMTFEGDTVGKWLIDIMKSSPAKEKKLLIDSYSKVVINDHMVKSIKYLNDKDFRNEVKETNRLISDARSSGIKVKYTNPVGFFGLKYPLRNHKKMIILNSKISFIGGINFSDHNFAWHDMMVEMNNKKIGTSLADDFNVTWSGHNQSKTISTNEGQLYFFNGSKSRTLYEKFFERIKHAKKSVNVISPYISEPLLGTLRYVASNGVKVTIVSPEKNNKSIFKNIILAEQRKGYFQLKEYPGMSHMKAMLIDDERLIFGSSNYDLVSYYFEQEVVYISEDIDLIQDFKLKVMSDTYSVVKNRHFSKFDMWKASTLMYLLNKIGRIVSQTILQPH